MDSRVLVFLIVLGTCSWCCNTRMVISDPSPVQNAITSELQINQQLQATEDEDLCVLCEVLAGPIVQYLSNNMSKLELIAALHLFCDLTFIMRDECRALVDHYLPRIYNETSVLTPKQLCEEIGVCDHCNCSNVTMSICSNVNVTMSQHHENSCKFCHCAVTEVLLKLKHPEYQTVELLLKACNAVKGSVENCKGLVLANAQLIPVYAKPLLETHGICTLLPACSSTTNSKVQVSGSETSTHSAY